MPKYLKTKEGSLESAVEAVSTAQQAAIAISKKEKAGKPGYDKEGKSLKDDMTTEDKEAYEKFFKSALKKFGVDSPADFKSDEEKKKFFDYVDKNYKGENEKAEEVKEETLAMKTAKHISDMWAEASSKKDVKSEEEDEDEKKEDGKTMTGKPMSKVDTKVVEKD
jgi:hypothetical protein|tara:strand:- start:9 stop:503 length:495 start_codon:yes stop_codon:yes gene_type:complete